MSFSAPSIIASSNNIAENYLLINFNNIKWEGVYVPKGYIFNWNGNIIRFDMKLCCLSPSLG